MYLMDVNIFVYAHREDMLNHAQYRGWLEDVINSDSHYGYSPLILSGFLRVVTHKKVFENPSDLDDAMMFVEQITSQPNAIKILPTEAHWGIFKKLVSRYSAKGNDIPDLYHAALAIESGSEWVTTDKGFKKIKDLKSIYPLA